MFPRRTRKSIWLVLLPLLLLRGLVPAGYMIEANADGLSIVVCDSSNYNDVLSGSSVHAHHHHAGGEHSGSAARDHSICPFAIAAVATPAPDLPVVVAIVATEIGRVTDAQVIQTGLSGPFRTQQSRAPPQFS